MLVLQFIPSKTMGDVRLVSYIVLNIGIYIYIYIYTTDTLSFLLIAAVLFLAFNITHRKKKRKLPHMQDVECCNKLTVSFLELSWMLLCTSIQNASGSQWLNSGNEKSHIRKSISWRPSLWPSVIITSKKWVSYPITAFNSEIKKIVFNFVAVEKFQDSSFSDVKEYFYVTFHRFPYPKLSFVKDSSLLGCYVASLDKQFQTFWRTSVPVPSEFSSPWRLASQRHNCEKLRSCLNFVIKHSQYISRHKSIILASCILEFNLLLCTKNI